MGERTKKIFENSEGWHNRFRQEVTNRVNEDLFKPLFSDGMGAPNAPIRILIAMMALKEGLGISDELLYEQARFNTLVRSALGLHNNDEEVPTESTYYLFRQKIAEYGEETGKDLLKEVFEEITKGQCKEYKVSGKCVRMDSTLIGSNIAWYSRYGIVHETIRKYCTANGIKNLEGKDSELLEEILKEKAEAVTYRSTKEEVEQLLAGLGRIIYRLLRADGAEGNKGYHILKRVFEEQYELVGGPGGGKKKKPELREKAGKAGKSAENPQGADTDKDKEQSIDAPETCGKGEVTLKGGSQTEECGMSEEKQVQDCPVEVQEAAADEKEDSGTDSSRDVQITPIEKKQITAKSVQSPHDAECEYRDKGGNKVKGYSVNVIETCNKGSLNLIVGVRAEGAGTPDVEYFEKGLEDAQKIVIDKIKEVHTDGAFHSPGNQEYCKNNNIDWVLRGIQGTPSIYDLSYDSDGNMVVINKETGERLEAKKSKSKIPDAPEQWRVKVGDKQTRYFDQKDVDTCELRKRLEEIPKDRHDVRNNVEATIFQLMMHCEGDKSRYRGLVKHDIWAACRCLWVNFRRIHLWITRKAGKSGGNSHTVSGENFLYYFFIKNFIRIPVFSRQIGFAVNF